MGGIIMALVIVLAAISIPLSAIILNSAVGKALAKYIDSRSTKETKFSNEQIEEIKKMKAELLEQRKLIYQLQEENQRLEEKYSFIERLIEAPKSEV